MLTPKYRQKEAPNQHDNKTCWLGAFSFSDQPIYLFIQFPAA